MKKSKVFIGPLEIANVAKSLAEAFRKQNITAHYYAYSTGIHPFEYGTDKVLFQYKKSRVKGINRFIRLCYFVRLIFKYNTFIFLSPDSILNKNADLPFLKLLRKKIIFIFTGCAERDPLFKSDQSDFICNRCIDFEWQKMFMCKELEEKRKRVQKFEKYSSQIVSQPDSAAYLKKTEPIWFYIIGELPPEKDYLSKFNEKKLVISHLPSNPLVKQTHIILPILNRIAKENDIEIVIKDGIWKRDKVLETLDKTHILVDALGLGYATLAIEGMSRGCMILSSFDEWFSKYVPEAPVYRTTAETLFDDLIHIIKNRTMIKDYANKSIKYYNDYHTPEAVGKFYKNKLALT